MLMTIFYTVGDSVSRVYWEYPANIPRAGGLVMMMIDDDK
jgi:hypothetical protein